MREIEGVCLLEKQIWGQLKNNSFQSDILQPMPHPEENYLVEKLTRLLESGKDQEYILKKYGTSSDVIQALLDAEDFVKL